MDPEWIGRVAVSPSVVLQKNVDSKGGNYALEMASFVEYLAHGGKQVVLFPHSARGATQATHNNDLPLCRTIYSLLPIEVLQSVEFVDSEWPSQKLRELIGSCDVLVTSRFHAMVSGLATSTPTLVIGWSHKYEEVLDMFDAAELAFPHSELDQETLRERFEIIWRNRNEISIQIASHLPKVHAKASEQLEEIASLCSKLAAK